jgi:hypothetical protein
MTLGARLTLKLRCRGRQKQRCDAIENGIASGCALLSPHSKRDCEIQIRPIASETGQHLPPPHLWPVLVRGQPSSAESMRKTSSNCGSSAGSASRRWAPVLAPTNCANPFAQGRPLSVGEQMATGSIKGHDCNRSDGRSPRVRGGLGLRSIAATRHGGTYACFNSLHNAPFDLGGHNRSLACRLRPYVGKRQRHRGLGRESHRCR